MQEFPWRELVEQILQLASVTARIETSIRLAGKSRVPTYAKFRSLAMLRANEIVPSRQPYLQKEFALFHSFYDQCMIGLTGGNEPSLEKIIKKQYDKL